MRRTEAVVIGGGQAGLATSRCLSLYGIDHVVLERGRVGERWRRERWDSLRLLSPNWHTRLPGFRYDGPDPDGFMRVGELVGLLERYARTIDAPVEEQTTVLDVVATGSGYRVATDRGSFAARSVVIATGHCDVPYVPPVAAGLAGDLVQLVPSRYRRPSQLPPGGVLVVGASASGVQLADEIHASGRPVTIAAGRHNRLPRTYRGRDIVWWLDAMGIFDEAAEDIGDLGRARSAPSLQLVGSPDRQTLDLPTLERRGVRLAGRLRSIDGVRVRFADDLVAHTAAADARLARLIQRIDAFASENALDSVVGPREPFTPFLWPSAAPVELDLRQAGIRSVIWATGYSRAYPWLRVPVLDERGEIRHAGGVTPAPGLYVLGLYLLRRRKSSFIDGVGQDAMELSAHLAGHLRRAA